MQAYKDKVPQFGKCFEAKANNFAWANAVTNVNYFFRATPGRIKKDHRQVPRQGTHNLRKGGQVQIARQRAQQVSPRTSHSQYFL